MNILNTSSITKRYLDNVLFDQVKLTLNAGDIIGLVGRNGEGKTTLLKLLAGIETPSSGTISWQKDIAIGYLDQLPNTDAQTLVYTYLESAFKKLHHIAQQLEYLTQQMANDTEQLDTYMQQYGALQSYYETHGGYEIDAKIRRVAHGLNITHLLDTMWGKLSGGERTKVCLAQILLQPTELLLLDEPTNHLDIKSIEWLTQYIKQYTGAVVIVSHDRYFLDDVTTQIIEIDQQQLHTYHGNYSYFVDEREKRILAEFEAYKTQQKKIKQMQKAIKQLRIWASQAKPPNASMFRRAKSMEKALNRIKTLEKPTLKHKQMHLDLKDNTLGADKVITMQDVSKTYDTTLLKNTDMLVRKNEHVAIVGNNGIGKSTLLKMILGHVAPDEGTVKTADHLKISYLSQHIFNDDTDDTLLETFRKEVSVTEGQARHILAQFMFYGEDVFKRVKDLSGGEKVRLRWAQIVNSDYHMLILDEPTNHLDIEAKETIEDALADYNGTVIAVSHDRYFLNKLFHTTYLLENQTLTKFYGNYDDMKNSIDKKE
ncbi:ABC transporter ATP-binding protein [Staphylococcus microti]|uniref:ABC transporter ATP-binding protein n=1 Tax=Staphylococcus microti TaxID=569857 RepID=A0A0D6XPX7_9STAP|nr:ABC-F type ribosomal protection protein [Staphylococcus microti]KIX89898.1 ABC transporter ATP-binding protein [Staphylococcus microti]PNZ79649.1 ABC transporter ATP-binding protein [Staphylococcus microti]SUM56548.1 ABC transporter ATP-binding protein [Staphylococcus microti]